MIWSVSVAAILFTGALTSVPTSPLADAGMGSGVAYLSVGADAPSVNLDGADAEQGKWSQRRSERDDEDSDRKKRKRGRVDHRDDEDSDSERRRGRVGSRDRDRDNDRFPRSRDAGRGGIAFDNGSNDGYDRGLADGRDGNQHDPVRHRHYRSADRGYDSRIGSREEYRNVYREGFRDGYERGYRDGENSRRSGNGRSRWPWPF